MPRSTSRERFQMMGDPGVQYHVLSKAGEPKYTEAGGPETAWRFPGSPTFQHSAERVSATANLVHSIETAPASAVSHGEQWYPRVQEAVSKGIRRRGFLSGHEDKMMAGAGLVAAVSPNMDWDRNNIDAFGELASLKSHHWDTILNAKTDVQKAKARDIVSGMSISSAALPNIQKAGRIIRGESPHDVIPYASAPKTHSFMHNIADPSNPHFVTIDGRAFDTLTNRMRPWEVNRGIGGSKTNKTPPGRYTAAGDIVKAVAGSMGIHPSAAQAISWSNTKYAIEQKGGERKQGPTRIGQPYFHPETGEPAPHMLHLAGAQFLGR